MFYILLASVNHIDLNQQFPKRIQKQNQSCIQLARVGQR